METQRFVLSLWNRHAAEVSCWCTNWRFGNLISHGGRRNCDHDSCSFRATEGGRREICVRKPGGRAVRLLLGACSDRVLQFNFPRLAGLIGGDLAGCDWWLRWARGFRRLRECSRSGGSCWGGLLSGGLEAWVYFSGQYLASKAGG